MLEIRNSRSYCLSHAFESSYCLNQLFESCYGLGHATAWIVSWRAGSEDRACCGARLVGPLGCEPMKQPGPWHGPGHGTARPWSGPWHGLVVRHGVAGRAMVQMPRGPPGRAAGPCVCVRARVRLPAAGARAGAVRPCYVLVTPNIDRSPRMILSDHAMSWSPPILIAHHE